MVAHHGIDPVQVVVGGALFWLPGLVWTWVLGPKLGWAQRIPLSMVAAFTIEPGAMMILHLVFAVKITLATTAFLSAALAAGGIAILAQRLWHQSTHGKTVGVGR